MQISFFTTRRSLISRCQIAISKTERGYCRFYIEIHAQINGHGWKSRARCQVFFTYFLTYFCMYFLRILWRIFYPSFYVFFNIFFTHFSVSAFKEILNGNSGRMDVDQWWIEYCIWLGNNNARKMMARAIKIWLIRTIKKCGLWWLTRRNYFWNALIYQFLIK